MSYESAKKKIELVRNETADGANTAKRVGDALLEMLEYARGSGSTTGGEIDKTDYLAWRLDVGTYIKNLDAHCHTLSKQMENEANIRTSVDKEIYDKLISARDTLTTSVNNLTNALTKLNVSTKIEFGQRAIYAGETTSIEVKAWGSIEGNAVASLTLQRYDEDNEEWKDVANAKYAKLLRTRISLSETTQFRVLVYDGGPVYETEPVTIEALLPIYSFFAPAEMRDAATFHDRASKYMTKANRLPSTDFAGGEYEGECNADNQRFFICIPHQIEGNEKFTMNDVTFKTSYFCYCTDDVCYGVYFSDSIFGKGANINVTCRIENYGDSKTTDRTGTHKCGC